MTLTTISVAGIESYQPAVDYRKSGRIGVLAGRNFAWDASGVYSGYASRLIDGVHSIVASPQQVQEIDLKTDSHAGVDGAIWRFTPSSPGSQVGVWDNITTKTGLIEANPANVEYNLRKWTSAFLVNRYACAWNYGVFKVNIALPTPTYTRLTNGTTPGFPADTDPVIAICESNGRMCYVNKTTFFWSAPNAPENLVPALGGAGFQVTGEKIAGTPFAITPSSNGCIVWTEVGALVCEFIGGDSVFRFYVLNTKALPLGSFAITRTPDDSNIILTRLGLYQYRDFGQPQPITPLFNEFLREYLRTRPTDFGHVWYSITDNRLYVTSRSAVTSFAQTFALEIVLDRWGIFSEPHLGIFQYGPSRGQLAYANVLGITNYLLSTLDSRKNKESAPGVFQGLGSSITVGWMRADNIIPTADNVQELQEIVVNRLAANNAAAILYFDEGLISDFVNGVIFDEGLVINIATGIVVDEGLIVTGDEVINYDLFVITDLFAHDSNNDNEPDTNIFAPILVRQNVNLDLWTVSAPSAYFRLQFNAVENNKFFRLNSMDLTVSYYGKQA